MKKCGPALGLACCLLLSGALCGCAARPAAERAGTAPNEVLTLTEVPADKLLLTMRVEDGVDAARFERALEAQFPEVDLAAVPNTPAELAVPNDDLPDLILSTFSGAGDAQLPSKLLDLSGQSFTQNYHTSALNSCAVDGALPYLPGLSNVYGVVYDKELFAQNGWEVPDTLDGFIELCRAIESTGLRAVQPALYYANAARQLFAGFNYQALFAGAENYDWLHAYGGGDGAMAARMAPGFDVMQRLLDAGIVQSGDFETRPRIRSDRMYRDHSCAMILETQMAPAYAAEYGGENAHALGMMPFFSGGPDSDYLLCIPNFYIGLNAKLAEAGAEAKLDKALELLAWLSTPAGQEAIIDPATPTISSVKGVSLSENDFFADVMDTIEKGHVVEQPFWVGTSDSAVDAVFREGLAAWSRGERTAQAVMADCDGARDGLLTQAAGPPLETAGTVEKPFTVMETSLYLAELFRREMDADFGLCLSNSHQNGNYLKLYAGALPYGGTGTLDVYLDRSFEPPAADGVKQGGLLLAELTGAQLLELLNAPPSQHSCPDAYYAAAGLTVEFAPWAGDGNRYVSVKLADGTDLDPSGSYTAAFWRDSVREEFTGGVQAASPRTAAELLYADVKERGRIAPADDGRFTLNWDLTASARD